MEKKLPELVEQFEDLTIKKQMKILVQKAVNSKLFYKEIVDEFEKTLLLAILEKYEYNLSRISLDIRLHRNTIAQKIKKYKIKEKRKKIIKSNPV